jgi:lactococcin 972 family bacteriocin
MAKLRIRKSLAAVIISASAMVAVAAPAMAAREFVGGGTWDHGLTGLQVYSNYYHPNNDHRSSVAVNGIITRSACTSPGNWSHAQAWQAVSGNKAYWNNAC